MSRICQSEREADVDTLDARQDARGTGSRSSTHESWYRAIFQESLDGILLATADGRILAANPAICALLGYTEAELRHIGRAAIIDPTDPQMQQALEERRSSGRFAGVVTYIARDGRRIPVDVSARVFTDEAATPVTIIFVRDATERIRAETTLRESEERFRLTLRNSPTNVFTADADLRYTWLFNPPRLVHNETIIGRRDDEILPPEQVVDLIAVKREVIETGRSIRREVRVAVRGEEHLYDMTLEPLRDADGKVTGLTAAATDITERWRHEQERGRLLQEALAARTQAELDAERARKATQARDRVLGVVSHDLRNPLTAIAMAIDAIAREIPAPRAEPVEWLIEVTRPAVSYMQRLIRDMLDSASIESGRLALHRAPTDVKRLLERLERTFADRLDAAGIRFTSELSDDLPLADMDGGRILQVLGNLLANAIAVVQRGGSISLGVRREQTLVLIALRDTGPGIPSADVPYLFEPYWRSPGTRAEGAGLGLSICKSIVEAHGGRIWVETIPGEGATFMLRMPVFSD